MSCGPERSTASHRLPLRRRRGSSQAKPSQTQSHRAVREGLREPRRGFAAEVGQSVPAAQVAATV